MFNKFLKNNGDYLYAIFRILVGFLFFGHGAQKTFGWFGAPAVNISSLVGAAGIIELAVGLTLLLGLYTRLFALLGAAEMCIAYVIAHWKAIGFSPFANNGEPALMFLAAFLAIFVYGGKTWMIEKLFSKKEYF